MRVSRGVILVAFLVASVISYTYLPHIASAADPDHDLVPRSLTLQTGAGGDGGSKPGGTVNHKFDFKYVSGGTVGSIAFEYCTAARGTTCDTPTGLTTTGVSLGNESGATSFSVVNTTNGRPYLTRTAAAVTGGTDLSYTLNGVVNPSATNQAFYVRIQLYGSTTASGTLLAEGSVAASTANQLELSGTMPESLIFCTGSDIQADVDSGIPDCTTAVNDTIVFDKLFSPTDTAYATSKMAASTNAQSGYVITVNGSTMTSGSNTIPAMGSIDTSKHGIGQFGLNLKENTTTLASPFGAEVTPADDLPTQYRGQAAGDYATADSFKFISGEAVANSAAGGNGPTNSQIFTVSYIVNVTGAQTAGTYTTILTYICTPTF